MSWLRIFLWATFFSIAFNFMHSSSSQKRQNEFNTCRVVLDGLESRYRSAKQDEVDLEQILRDADTLQDKTVAKNTASQIRDNMAHISSLETAISNNQCDGTSTALEIIWLYAGMAAGLLAFAIAMVFIAKRAWAFFLARIREIGKAFRGEE